MNKKLLKPKLYNGLFVGFSLAFSVFLSGRGIALSHASALNDFFDIKTSDFTGDGGEDATYFKRTYQNPEEVKAYFKDTAIQAEGEGLVLLKNEGKALPLKAGSRLALFGTASYALNYNTSGSSSTDSSTYKTFQDSLKDEGFSVNKSVSDLYHSEALKAYGRTMSKGSKVINEAPYSLIQDVASSALTFQDTAIVTLARESGEGSDLSTIFSDGEDGSYLSLSKEEIDLLTGLTSLKKQGKLSKIVVLLNSSNPIATAFLKKEGVDVDALLWIGNVGAYGIDAVSQVFSGKINPSGRLSDTYTYDSFSSPAMESWKNNKNMSFGIGYSNFKEMKLNSTNRVYAVYNEGIYVGYRYYETRYEDSVLNQGQAGDYVYQDDVSFPFGYGLSYTTFSYSDFKVTENAEKDAFDIQVTVKNTGEVAGKHSVEIYLQKPYTDYDRENGLEKASVELAGFTKTGLLQADQSETVHVTVKKSQLKSYDSNKAKTYILEKGDYYLTLGKDSHHAVNNILTNKSSKNEAKLTGEDGQSSLSYRYRVDQDDFTTYSVSEYTKEKITNQLDHADMNRYEGRGDNHVTYLSRNQWKDTYPKAVNPFVVTTKMKEDLTSHKPLPNDGALPTYDSGKKMSLIELRGLDFENEKWDELLDSMSKEDQIKLVTDGQLVTTTLSSINLPGTIEKDGPTAVTTTQTGSSFPSEGIWASTLNRELIQKIGDAFAEDILLSEVHGIYAPGVNIHRTPFGGRSNEYFSEDPYLSGISAVYEIQGLQSKGIVTHLKHFAFNNEETYRNGICIWLNEQSAREIYLLPFELAVTQGKTGAVMSSFNRSGCLWTGGDSNLSIQILQKEFGFKGYSITDMGSANGGTYMVYDDAYMGGTNLFMGPSNTLDEYKNNASFLQMVRESSHRILYTIVNQSVAMNGITSSTDVKTITPWWETTINALCISTGVLAFLFLAGYLVSVYFLKKQQ